MTKIFISYVRGNIDLAERMFSLLNDEFDVFWDQRILGGTDWQLRIDHELDAANWLIALFTKDSIENAFFRAEAMEAFRANKLIPLKFDDCALPTPFHSRQYIALDRADPRSCKEWEKLLASLRQTPEGNGEDVGLSARLDKGPSPIPASADIVEALDGAPALPPPAELPPVEANSAPAGDPVDFAFTAQDMSIADGSHLLRKALKRHSISGIQAAARGGQAEAQLLMGIATSEGLEVERNLEDAGQWLRLAADLQHPRAQAEYAWHLGQTLRDPDSASLVVEASRLALEAGTSRGRTVYATHRLDGLAVGITKAEAVDLLRLSAGDGDMLAATVLGWALVAGKGVKRDAATAASWLKDAAEHGNALAQANYGRLFLLGRGVRFDPVRAAYWLERSARQGHVWGEYFYAWAFEQGAGVTRDLEHARYWYERSARQGDSDAQVALARLCLEGLGGARDVAKAHLYLEKAVEHEDIRACMMLGELYEDGLGVEVDLDRAVALYRKAADRSYPPAALRLGLMYDWGRGVARDQSEARRLLKVAAGQLRDVPTRTKAERKLAMIGA